MNFEKLDVAKHNRKDFDCGVEELNVYLKQIANQDQRRNLTRVYVLAEEKQIIGYYSISGHSVSRDTLPTDIKFGSYQQIPFLLLGRLAVDKQYQGNGYGDALIFHALKMTVETAEKIGILGIIVEAKDDKVAMFYEGFGFKRLSATKNRLVLPLNAIIELL
ncbi:MAG: GNAT family N-acetyltransferase [Methylococcales bacterium]|jgi:predicted GNAT family N-acyltransferase